jgi:hypothetical protein
MLLKRSYGLPSMSYTVKRLAGSLNETKKKRNCDQEHKNEFSLFEERNETWMFLFGNLLEDNTPTVTFSAGDRLSTRNGKDVWGKKKKIDERRSLITDNIQHSPSFLCVQQDLPWGSQHPT